MGKSSHSSPLTLTVEVPLSLLRTLYRTMVRIREFEEKAAALLEQKEIRCPVHLCIGQEGVAAGVCAALERTDYVFGAHRSHGHYLAKGGDMNAMMAELMGKSSGCSRGRGGSMHLVAPEVGLLGTVPIVAASIPIAVGTALASKLRGEARVTVAFFGDGATEEGAFHESMNLAAHHVLPVVFICENNYYASHLHLFERRAADNIVMSAEAHGMPGSRLDGNDAVQVHGGTAKAVARARGGEGPSLLECVTYRWRGHVGPAWDTDVGVTRKVDLAAWMKKDPILRLRERLMQEGVAAAELEQVVAEARSEVEAAVEFARQSPYPAEDELLDWVFSDSQGLDRSHA